MKIGIEARSLSNKGSGLYTYTYELIRHLAGMEGASDNLSVFYDDEKQIGKFSEINEIAVKGYGDWFFLWWFNKVLPRAMESIDLDLVHFTKGGVPSRKVGPTVVTILDVIPILYPESQKLSRRWYWPRTLKHAALNSDHIVTISQASKRDIVRLFGVPEDKVTVTELAVDTSHFRSDALMRSGNPPYILHVGRIDTRKNIPLLVRAFSAISDEIPHQLIIAGNKYNDYPNVIEEINKAGLADRIKVLSYVSYDKLPALYRGADVMVAPSSYEGWGFSPQESMACGTPVIVSDGGSLPEVVGDAGVVVPFAIKNIADRGADKDFENRFSIEMKRLLMDKEERECLSRKGLERVKGFSWSRVADSTLSAYKKVLGV